MYPSGQMNDPWTGNYGAGCTMPCCSGHGYSYCFPPGPVTPYQHLYPSPHSYVAPQPLMHPYCHHHHHPHYHPMPGTPAAAGCCVPSDASFPIQQQQHQAWRPMVVPPGNCCFGLPNHHLDYGNPWSAVPSNDAKVSNGPEPEREDVKKVDGMRPVLWSGGSNSSQPQLFWIPPQYVSNLQHQGADKEPRDGKGGGQFIPFNLDKLASLHNNNSIKPVTAGGQKEYPFPIILMPGGSDNSREITSKNRISEIEEKPSSCNNTEPLKLLCNGDVERTVPPERVKTSEPHNDSISGGIQAQSEKVGVKDIPVKQAVESIEKKSTTNAGGQKEYPFPIILVPRGSDNSREITSNGINEIKEDPSSCNNTEPLKLLYNADVEKTVPPEPVKTSEHQNDSTSPGIQAQSEKVRRVKDIPVKQAGESREKKPTTNAAAKSPSRSTNPTKITKLPPVCLRVDPLPRKKNGNGTPKPLSSPSYQKDMQQQPVQTDSAFEDLNSKEIKVSEAKTTPNTDNTKNVKVVEASSDATGNVNEGDIMESGKAAQPEAPVGLEGGSANDVKTGKMISEEMAAVRIQSAYRGYEERKWHSLQKLRQIAKVREQISGIKDRLRALENSIDMNKDEFERQKLVLGETIMSHLLTLDTIQGLHPSIRDVRKSVAKDLISLQEKLDIIYAQRFREREDAADNSEINEGPSRKSDEQDSSDVINACDQQNKQKESYWENIYPLDTSVNNSENLTENKSADPHQKEAHADNFQADDTHDVTRPIEDSPEEGSLQNFNTDSENDSKLMSSPDEVEDSGKQITEGVILKEQSLDGGNNYSVAKAVSEHEYMANCGIVAVDSQTVETSQTVIEGKSNPFCCTAADIGEVISGEVVADADEQVSQSGEETTVESRGETIEQVCNHVEEQSEVLALGTEYENSDEQGTITTNTSASEEIPHSVEEIDKLAPSPICNELLNSDVANEIDAIGMGTRETESEESIVTDNDSGAGTLAAGAFESDKGNVKSEASFEDVNCLAEDDGVSINDHETPRLRDVSRTSTDNADSVVLAEENEKLRETVRKLLESGKDQLAVILTLNERLRNLEKKLKKKRNRKIKFPKSSNKNHEAGDQKIPICSM